MKPTIEEALQARIPLPWKQSTCDGPPIWKVERQRPEDFTAEIYQQLRKYGMKEDEIRNLFYISNADYARLKKQVGAVPLADEPESKPRKQYKNCFPNAKKTAVRAVEIIQGKLDVSIDGNGPIPGPADIIPAIAQAVAEQITQSVCEQVGIPHAPTEAEKEDVFRPADSPERPVSLRDCAAKLMAAIDARESADKQIEFYTSEIRRLA